MIKDYLRSMMPGDFRFSPKMPAKTFIDKIKDGLIGLAACAVKQNDRAILAGLNEHSIREGVSDFLTERGFVTQSEPSGHFQSKELMRASIVDRVLDALPTELSKLKLRTYGVDLSVSEDVIVSVDSANLIRSNFTSLQDNIDIALSAPGKSGSISSRIQSGRLHPIYGSALICRPSLVDYAVNFMLNAGYEDNAELDSQTYLTLQNTPDDVKYNPIFAALNRSHSNYMGKHAAFKRDEERHRHYGNDDFSFVLEVMTPYSLSDVIYADRNTPAGRRIKASIFRTLANSVLNCADLRTFITSDLKLDYLHTISSAGTFEELKFLIENQLRYILSEEERNYPPVADHTENPLLTKARSSPEEMTVALLSNIGDLVYASELRMALFDKLSELCENTDKISTAGNVLEKHAQDLIYVMRNTPMLVAATQTFNYSPITDLILAIENISSDLFNDYLNFAPLSVAHDLLSRCQQHNDEAHDLVMRALNSVNHASCSLVDVITKQVSELLGTAELEYPGITKDINIGTAIERKGGSIDDGLLLFHQLVNQPKQKYLDAVAVSAEAPSMDFLNELRL